MDKFYNSSAVNSLHMDVTSKCNAACPMCTRNIFGSNILSKDIPAGDFQPEWFDNIDLDINKILINGVYGDIVMHPKPLELINKIKSKWPNCKVSINTNGAALKPAIWEEFAKLGIIIEFGIDGTDQTTHEKYRRNTRLDRIYQNATAFINAGGSAYWAFTVFAHNAHQLGEAQKIASEMGFAKFKKRSNLRTQFLDYPSPIMNDSLDVVDWIWDVGMDTNKNVSSFKKQLEIKYKTNQIKDELFATNMSVFNTSNSVNCKAAEMNNIYLNGAGFLYPCCFLGRPELWNNLLDLWNIDHDFNSIINQTASSILGNQFWEILDNSFNGNSCNVCEKTCGATGIFTRTASDINPVVLNNGSPV